MALFDEVLLFLEGLSHDPIVYSIVFFILTVAATSFLPIPIVLGLFFSPETPIVVKVLLFGSGRAVGSFLVFMLGGKIGGWTMGLFSKNRVLREFMKAMQWFVAKTRYFGLYAILSAPAMVDTIPLYIFSLFNQKGEMDIKWFALTNFFAGVTRAVIVYAIFYWLGIRLA